jgi:Mg/Co/Ni transporter MgtE
VRAAGWDACVVVNEERIVMGLLRAEQLAKEGTGPIEGFMRPGPSTFRPNVSAHEMAEFFIEHDMANAPITTNEGRLVGLLRRADAAKAALEQHQGHERGEEGGGS